MMYYNIITLVSFAFRRGCSFIGGRPYQSAFSCYRGELVFMSDKKYFGGEFIQWVRWNFDCDDYKEVNLIWKNKEYIAMFLLTPYKISHKFLFSFKNFCRFGLNKVMFFNQ